MLVMLVALVRARPIFGDVRASLQARATESGVVWRSDRVCGVNCLYAMLKIHNISCNYGALTQELIKNGKPASLSLLRDSATAHGLVGITVGKTDRVGAMYVRKPFIAHLDSLFGSGRKLEHYVLVLDASDDDVLYLDGTSAQIRRAPWDRFEQKWTGYVLYERSTRRWRLLGHFAAGAVAAGAFGFGILGYKWRSRRQENHSLAAS